jgi:hypothetical protein
MRTIKKFYQTLGRAKNAFDKLPTPSASEAFYLVQFSEGVNRSKFAIMDEQSLEFNGERYEQIDIKL